MPILYDWLNWIYLLEEWDHLPTSIEKLKQGEMLINAKGDIFCRCSVIYHGENAHLSGLFERQNKLDVLQENLPGLQT